MVGAGGKTVILRVAAQRLHIQVKPFPMRPSLTSPVHRDGVHIPPQMEATARGPDHFCAISALGKAEARSMDERVKTQNRALSPNMVLQTPIIPKSEELWKLIPQPQFGIKNHFPLKVYLN